MEKLSLGKQQKLFLIGGGVVFIGILLLFIVYLPLSSRISEAGKELSRIHSELKSARETVSVLIEGKGDERHLATQEGISVVMDELTRLGKEWGVNFRSIRPQPVEKTQKGYDALPVLIRFEAPYRDVGRFLGALRSLRSGIVNVAEFDIDRDEESLPALKGRLLLKLALRPGSVSRE